MKLGIVYKNGEIINHRSLVKVLLNPVFRYFGFCIGTVVDKGKVGTIKFIKCDREKIRWKNYGCDYDFIVRKRILL